MGERGADEGLDEQERGVGGQPGLFAFAQHDLGAVLGVRRGRILEGAGLLSRGPLREPLPYSSIMLLRTASIKGETMKLATVRSPVVMITSAGMPAVRRPRISSGMSF